MDPPSLTVFFPCYNDEKTIGRLVAEADAVARAFTGDYEIIVVDDGSQDGSRALLAQLRNDYPELRLVFHEKNQGYGAALCSGFQCATKDWIFYTDGDGQYDVSDLRPLLPLTQVGMDMVNGYRVKRNDPLYRILIGPVYLWFTRFLFRLRLRDVTCDFRLIRREALGQIRLRRTSGAVCLELVKKLEGAGLRILEYPVHHYTRPYGRSQYFNLRELFRTGRDLIRLWREKEEDKQISREKKSSLQGA
jgi:glycosyltransferase involved in cell wall biosynthesis